MKQTMLLGVLASIVLLSGGITLAQTVTILHSFNSNGSEGDMYDDFDVDYKLVQASDGNFYGTTPSAGTGGGYGTVFRLSPSGSFTNLHSFSGIDGTEPTGALLQGSDGNFYGTTYGGGTNFNTSSGTYGTVFQMTPGGAVTSWSFDSYDGDEPLAGLMAGSDGNFYGTTLSGGTLSLQGTVFRISPGLNESVLWNFTRPGGILPKGGLTLGRDGNFYGTTSSGGINNDGTVFLITPGGSLSNLYSFSGLDGQSPMTDLILGSDGNFYGTTEIGGTNVNTDAGTIFRISPTGSLTTLHSFDYNDDGGYPNGLVQGSDGYFYGTTYSGGTNGYGTLFRMGLDGSFATLHTFTGPPGDGEAPQGRLIQGSDGSFYGATGSGGSGYNGTVFKLTVLLNPPPYPVNQITGLQLAGNNVVLSVPSVEGETYQLQQRASLTQGGWSNIPGTAVTNSIGGLMTLTNIGGALAPQAFYRVAITP